MAHRVLIVSLVMQLREMLRAGFGGVAATATDVSMLVLLVKHAHTPVALATFIAAACGAAVGFTLNKYIAFRDRSPITFKQVGRFALVAVATALLMAGLMQLIAVKLGAPLLVATLICSALVFVAWTYPAQRRLVFKRRRPQPWMSLS
jgi:putative flippase GtrA